MEKEKQLNFDHAKRAMSCRVQLRQKRDLMFLCVRVFSVKVFFVVLTDEVCVFFS